MVDMRCNQCGLCRYLNLFLLPRIRDDIAEYKKLNFHLYQVITCRLLFMCFGYFFGVSSHITFLNVSSHTITNLNCHLYVSTLTIFNFFGFIYFVSVLKFYILS